MSITVKDALTKSLWLCGAVGQGQTPSGYLLTEALSSLNMMLDMWSSSPQGIFYNTHDYLTLTRDVWTVTIGSGGGFDTARPIRVFDSTITVGSTSHPIISIFRDQYDSIPNKNTQGQPRVFYYEPTNPLGTIRFYPAPDAEYTFTLASLKPLPQYTLNDTIDLPPGYTAAIVYGLAVFITPGIGKQLRAEIVSLAQQSYDQIATSNFVNQMRPMSTNPIYEDEDSDVSRSGFTYTFPFTL